MEHRYEIKGYVVIGCGYRWKISKGNVFIGTYCDTLINIRTNILVGRIR